jgi:glycosyltransferase involved in cell wall biosynthesis
MIKIITTVYNAEKYIDKCIKSVLNQDLDDWEMYITDDGSGDKTADIIKKYNDNRIFSKFITKNKRAPLEYIVNSIYGSSPSDEDIIILLDGDDWLASNDVFSYLSNIYSKDSNLLMTYGQFHPSDSAYSNFCKPIDDVYRYRESGSWVTSHLRTFKFKLFKNIKNEDLIDPKTGAYYPSAWDVAIILPMLEMSGNDRYICIEKILYIYNNENQINDMTIRKSEQLNYANDIRKKEKYNRIKF